MRPQPRTRRFGPGNFLGSAAAAFAILTDGATLPDDATWFATDSASLDRPYLWRSLQWQRAPHLVATMGPRAMVYLDWSLIFSAATAALVMVLAFLLILAPLGRMPAILPPLSRLSIAVYFILLGLGYLLIEAPWRYPFTGRPPADRVATFDRVRVAAPWRQKDTVADPVMGRVIAATVAPPTCCSNHR